MLDRRAPPRKTATGSPATASTTPAPEVETNKGDTKDKKKQQRALDSARVNVERAETDLQTKTTAETYQQQGLAEGKPVQPALTAATKKRKTAETKLESAKADVDTKTDAFKEKFKCDPAAPAPVAIEPALDA